MKSVYCVLVNGIVKVGVSSDPEKRMKQIKNASGGYVEKYFFTEKSSNSFQIERILHKKFSCDRLHGEWFKSDFEKVKMELIGSFSSYAKFESKKGSPLDPFELLSGMMDNNNHPINLDLIKETVLICENAERLDLIDSCFDARERGCLSEGFLYMIQCKALKVINLELESIINDYQTAIDRLN